jgi:uncharacterized membrane protein YkoI
MNTKTTNRRRTALLLVSSLGLTATLAACGTSTPDATVTPAAQQVTSTTPVTSDDDGGAPSTSVGTPSTSATSQPTATSTGALLASVTVTPEDAARTALATVASSRVVGIDLDRRQGAVAWDVDVVTNDLKREVIVDAKTGAVLANRVDDSDDSDDVRDDRRMLDMAKVDHVAAVRTAVAEVPDGRVVDLDLDEDDGTIQWEVDVIAPDLVKHELTINAASGAVVKHETE